MPVISRLAAATARAWGFFAQLAGGAIGALYTWGKNDQGQLGLNSISSSQQWVGSPVQLGSGSNINLPIKSRINSNQCNTFQIKQDGTLWVAGDNYFGSCGQNNDSNIYKSSPIQIGSDTNWSKIVTGYASVYGLKTDNTLWVWGNNDEGQLGLNNTINYSSPVQLAGSWSSVSYGFNADYVYGIKTDGTLWVWGRNQNGTSGQNIQNYTRSSPVQIGSDTDWASAFAAGVSGFAIKTNGSLWAWGRNGSKEAGTGNTEYSSPVQIAASGWTGAYIRQNQEFTTIALKANGTVWVWGSNNYGGLGNDKATGTASSPIQLGSKTYIDVSANYSGFNAIDSNGNLWAWGRNNFSTLGTNDSIDRSSPVQIGQNGGPYITLAETAVNYNNPYIAVENTGKLYFWGYQYSSDGYGAANHITQGYSRPIQIGNWGVMNYWSTVKGRGDYSLRELRYDGQLFAQGYNADFGALGVNNLINYSSPVQVGSVPWASVSAGGEHSLGIKTDGTLWAWGWNGYGALGLDSGTDYSSPVQVGSQNTWQSISGGSAYFSAGIKIDQTLWAWGNNNDGEIGRSNTVNYSSPVQVAGSWASVSCGYNHMGAIKPNGQLWLWGANLYGQLGNNQNNNNYSSPIQVSGTWSVVSCGYAYTMGIKTDGTLWAWGYNNGGRLGISSAVDRSSPVQVGSDSSWVDVFTTSYNTVATKSDGTVWTFGNGFNGLNAQGVSSTISYSSPVQVGALTTWQAVGGGQYGIQVNKTDGSLWVWGSNVLGQLGQNVLTYIFGVLPSSPVQVGSDVTWSDFSTQGNYCLAVKSDGTLWSWGQNSSGCLGLGDTVKRSSPVQVGSDTNWYKVATALNTVNGYALKTNGTIWAWGTGSDGQLGNGNNIDLSSPIQIGSQTDWTSIFAGFQHAGGLRGTNLYVWGANNAGELAQGTTSPANYSSPVQVTGSWNFASLGYQHLLGIKSTGTLWACGYNSYGQLGQNNRTDYSSPVQIGSDTWTFACAGLQSSFAVKSNGTLWTWGENDFGQLGLGDTTYRSSPVQVGAGTTWSKIYVKNYGVLAIKTDNTLWAWGNNALGELGLNNTITYSSPVQVGSLSWVLAGTGQNSSGGIVRV